MGIASFRKIDIFHKLILFIFPVEILLELKSDYYLNARLNRALGIQVPELLSISAFLILLLFIIGCIRSKIWKKTVTINYYLFMFILLVNGVFLVKDIASLVILPAIIIFGLTRKYWEVKPSEKT